jgi:amino acid adenylation domain-containing protein
MISHRASLTFVSWACATFGLQATDRVSSHAPLHFDLSIFDLFATIKAGGTVVLVPEELSIFPVNLADFIEEQRIAVWYSVPSVLTRLVLHGELKRHRFSALHTVLFAGEVFPLKYLRQLTALLPHPRYFNLYGPTETNVCTYYPVSELPPEWTEPLPIGRACANTDTFAVTDQGTIASAGEVGELYVRGPTLAKGYWGLPERSKEVFVANPIRPVLWEEKVYRTGDLVRVLADGNYLFLGRRDNMIKSRGFRIELGEIEAVLYRHPAIEEAAAIPVPDELAGNLIKAIIVTRPGQTPTRGDLEHFCAERLPRYMVPSMIEYAASLPKTSTGKIDRPLLIKEHAVRRPNG